jgi:hypothetical protein
MRRTCILGLALAVLLIVAATSVNAGKCDLQGYLSDDGKLKLEICTTPQGYVMIRRTWVPTGAFTEVQFDADPDQNGLVHEQRVTTLGWHEQYAHGHPFSDLDPIEVESGSYGQHVLGWITGCDDDDMTYQQCRDCLGRQATGMIVRGIVKSCV